MLPLASYRLRIRARDDLLMPEYAGSAWRGVFGHALKASVCVTRQHDCAACALYRSCVYSYIFETPRPETSDRMRLYPYVPHPFVLAPAWPGPRTIAAGDPGRLEFRLFGRAVDHLPYVLHAFVQAGLRGIGQRRGRYDVVDLEWQPVSESGPWRSVYRDGRLTTTIGADMVAIPPVPDGDLLIRFETPLRLQVDGRPCAPESLRFEHLLRSLMRRVGMLAYFHADDEVVADFRTLAARASEVEWLERRLEWADWRRYSSRQRRSMKLGGLLGECRLDGTGLEPFWPLLWVGQWTHVGKATSMGLGRYRLECLANGGGHG